MKMEKHWKRFFTLDRHHAEGFTLVELIVVIAILAILAGVAVPAYSGYIAKANEAADLQLMDAMTTAFHSACIDENVSVLDMELTEVDLTGESGAWMFAGFIYPDGIDFGNTLSETLPSSYDPFETTFLYYFGNASELVFTASEKPDIVFLNGAFVEGSLTFNFGGKEITLSAKDVAILSGDNAFSDRGSAALLSDVGALETYLGGGFLDDSILTEIGASDEFMSAFAGYLGLKQEDYEKEDDYWTAYEEKLVELEASNPNATTNALIMYAASSAGGTTTEEMSGLFTYVEGGALTSRIEGSTNEETMANAALAYGMYTAYAQHNGISSADPSKFTSTVNTKEFADYVASAEGQADLEAYMAAMNMISDNTGNPEVTNSILNNGITGNQDLADLMKEVMGS